MRLTLRRQRERIYAVDHTVLGSFRRTFRVATTAWESSGDFGVTAPLGDEAQDVEFAFGELC
jgi:hypothetical protein